MSYAARETSQYSGQPYELYLFQTQTDTWRMTSADGAITYLGNSYEPEAITRTPTSQGVEVKSGEVRVTIPKTHPIALLYLPFIPATPMSLVIYRGHDAESEVVVNFTGRVATATFGDACELACVPEQEALKKRIPGPKYQKQCNRILYAPGCDVDRELFRVTGNLSSVVGAVIQAPEFATKPNGWFNAGYIEKGFERRMILSHTGNALTLLQAMAGLAVGDVISAYAGCKRNYNGDCVQKFNNGANFFGFEWIPLINPFRGTEY